MPEGDKYFEKFIPAKGPLPKQNGFQREHLMAAFHHVQNWGVALDIGAHVGFWTRDMAELFGKVYAFEACRDTYECLVKNTDDLPNVQCMNVAVGDRLGICRIRHDPKRERGGNTGSRFVQPVQCGKDHDVRMINIDSLLLANCGFIKADVEGFEFHVLTGAQRTIKRFRPVIIMECMPANKGFEHRYDLPEQAAEKRLLEYGYKEVAHMRPDKIFVPV